MSLLKIRKKNQEAPKEIISFPMLNDNVLGISDEAAQKIINVCSLNDTNFLKIAIKGGGCRGLSINYELCNEYMEKDLMFEHKGAKVLIDEKSLTILGGSTLHVNTELGVSVFALINNKNAKQCSCGKSFSL